MPKKIAEGIKCPKCHYPVDSYQDLRCPRCYTVLVSLDCPGSCSKCKKNTGCYSPLMEKQ